MAAFTQFRRLAPQWICRCIRPQSNRNATTRGVSTLLPSQISILRKYPSYFQKTPPAGCAYKYWILGGSDIITPYLLPSTSLSYPPDYDLNPPPGCDFHHWLVAVEDLENIKFDSTREDYIDAYVKLLAKVLQSEEEAGQTIYSISTIQYTAFRCNVSKEIACKIKELPGVVTVFPDSHEDCENKTYGGEPFINGQAVPYDPKYYENFEWFYWELLKLKFRAMSDSDSDQESSDYDTDKVASLYDSGDKVMSDYDSDKTSSN